VCALPGWQSEIAAVRKRCPVSILVEAAWLLVFDAKRLGTSAYGWEYTDKATPFNSIQPAVNNLTKLKFNATTSVGKVPCANRPCQRRQINQRFEEDSQYSRVCKSDHHFRQKRNCFSKRQTLTSKKVPHSRGRIRKKKNCTNWHCTTDFRLPWVVLFGHFPFSKLHFAACPQPLQSLEEGETPATSLPNREAPCPSVPGRLRNESSRPFLKQRCAKLKTLKPNGVAFFWTKISV